MKKWEQEKRTHKKINEDDEDEQRMRRTMEEHMQQQGSHLWIQMEKVRLP